MTGSTTTSTVDEVNLRIWDGPPGLPESNIVFGDAVTNRLASSTFANIYRAFDTNLTDTQRPIMKNVVTVGTTLEPGTYFLDWATGSTTSGITIGPFAPPVTILGLPGKPGANARQYDDTWGIWYGLIDSGNGAPQDLPFVIEGTVASGPRVALVKTVGTTPGVCATTSAITVPAGTTVYYCYSATNLGSVALTSHDLSDDLLGSIFTGFTYDLASGSTVNTVAAGMTISEVIDATTTNVGTWTARDATGAEVQAQSTATVTAIPPRCPAGSTEVVVLSQSFDGAFPPAGWTLVNSTTGCSAPAVPDWTNTDPGVRGNLTGGAGVFAIADSASCGSGSVMNAQLRTPPMDFIGLSDPEVTFYTYYNDISSASDVGDLDVSIDGGGAWSNLFSWNEDHRGPLLVTQSVPTAADQPNTLLRWNYTNATRDWWWEVDDVVVTACQPALVCELTCPPDIVQPNDAGHSGAIVTYPAPTTNGGCAPIACTPASGDYFGVGTTPVVCVEQTPGGQTCGFDVTVELQSAVEIPTASTLGLAALALLLAGATFVALRRHG